PVAAIRGVVSLTRPAVDPLTPGDDGVPLAEREHDADDHDEEPARHQDVADHVEIDDLYVHVDRECENRADGEEKDSCSDAHRVFLSLPNAVAFTLQRGSASGAEPDKFDIAVTVNACDGITAESGVTDAAVDLGNVCPSV